jgi:hypothetical protein
MPSRGTKYTKEIERLRAQGLGDARIAERLSVGKSIITRNLADGRTKNRLARLMLQAGLYSLKQALTSCEVGWRWIEGERLKLLEGKSTLTAADLGTIARNQERALEMAKGFLGKAFSPEDMAKAESKDDGLRRAREHVKAIQARAEALKEDGGSTDKS